MKKGISLIVLVITIIVMIILAASVVITLNNTGVINRASQATQTTNVSQIKSAIDLKTGELIMEKAGKQPTSFEVVEKLHESNIITDTQKTEMLTNGGELTVGEETIRLNTASVVSTRYIETVQTGTTWKHRFEGRLNKIDGVEYTEFGTMLLPKFLIESFDSDSDALDVFVLENADDLSILLIEAENYDNEETYYKWVAALWDVPAASKNTIVCARSYAKYTYNGVQGVIYSDIVETPGEN